MHATTWGRRSMSILGFALAVGVPLRGARAQTGGTTGSTALAESDFTISAQLKTDSDSWADLDASEAKVTFDQARCLCGSTIRFVVSAASSTATSTLSTLLADTGADGEGRLYLGQSSGCTTDPTESSYGCVLLDQLDALDSLVAKGYWVSSELSVTDLFASASGTCASSLTQYVWLWLDTASDGSADLTGASAPSLSLRLDGKAPAAPTALVATPGKEALVLGWTSSSTASASSSDLAGYLVFCAQADGGAVFASSPYDGQYVSPATLATAGLCPNQDGLDASLFTVSFANHAPGFLCSGLIAADQTAYRLKGLTNGTAYTVALVAVDGNGNLSEASDPVTAIPVLTVDFYGEYLNQGGVPVGGYCAIGHDRGRPGGLAAVAAAVLVALALRRRRRLRWCAVVAAIGLAATPAFGQAVFHDDEMPRLQDEVEDAASWASPRSMSVEFHLGPYRPDVDAGLDNGATPYATMFGSATRVRYELEVDYEVLQRFGTLAVGVGAGYFRATAHAFVGNTDGSSTSMRSADDTTFRLIPVSVLAVYRMDLMAERWRVPLVPFVKLGLNYTFWQVTDGNGEVAVSSQGARGAGGTAGWQVSAGLGIPLDLLDRASMRELDAECGLNHMYLVAEWSHVDASGLGLGSRLHVGDDTWDAGLLLEF
jgi:hypothetical protein